MAERCEAKYHEEHLLALEARSFMSDAMPELIQTTTVSFQCLKEDGHAGNHLVEAGRNGLTEFPQRA